MNDLSVKIFIFFCVDPVGMLRLDKIDEGYKISFSVDVNHEGLKNSKDQRLFAMLLVILI